MVSTRLVFVVSLFAMHSHISVANDEYNLANDYEQAVLDGQSTVTPEFLDALISNKEALTGGISEEPNNVSQGASRVNPDFITTITNKKKDAYNQVKQGQKKELPVSTNQVTYKILISDSMGKENLQHLIKSLSHRKDVSFVVRGLLPSETTINDVSKRIITLVSEMGLDDMPAVLLDPRPFQDAHAEFVPQILAYKGEELVLSASGLVNPDYMARMIAEGKKGDLGKFGGTYKIAERDITEVLKERMANLDQKKLIQNAKDSYWDKVSFLQLPNASETKSRIFVPLMTVNEDITTPDGQLIAVKGQRFNSLEHMPFTQRLVVFDATDKTQLDFVKSLPETPLRTKYITTRFDRKLKWDAVKYVEGQLQSSVYMLNADVINAFNVQRIPSVITADNDKNYFIINEYEMNRYIGTPEVK